MATVNFRFQMVNMTRYTMHECIRHNKRATIHTLMTSLPGEIDARFHDFMQTRVALSVYLELSIINNCPLMVVNFELGVGGGGCIDFDVK